MFVSSNALRHVVRTAAKTSGRVAFSRAVNATARLTPSVLASQCTSMPFYGQQVAFQSTVTESPNDPARGGYNTSRTYKGTGACKDAGIDKVGITGPTTVYKNLTYQELWEHEVKNGDGEIAKCEYGDCMSVLTGKYTGRSPKDRFLVQYPGSETDKHFDWNENNKPVTPETFEELYKRAQAHMNSRENVYLLDAYVGASPGSRRKVRFITEFAWHQHFCANMMIRMTDPKDLENYEPDFTLINVCTQIVPDWKKFNLHSETAVVFNADKKIGVVFGSYYGGEMKKGIFGLMNYWLPNENKLPMHCSANVGKDGSVALFFGLSGTGKTTLSADPNRALIGDDEHGWDDDGIFNFEGGCYAKTINLTEATEPDIYRAIKQDALFENVKLNPDKTPDYFDISITENGRVSYPIHHIDGYHKPQCAGHPNNIIFLSCDAFGVLPPIARLSPGQAMYHFMSGYTAKVAGTERGIKEPVPNFSACFGAAFMTQHPTRYADLLEEKLEKHGTKVFLVNSGWSGGPYGVGKRMSIKTTRTCVDKIIDGSINDVEWDVDPMFGWEIPKSIPGIDTNTLHPRDTWSDKAAYDETKKSLAQKFIDNFKKYEGVGSTDYTKYGPQI